MTDTYTKAVLTTIAAALVAIALENGTGRAAAQLGEPQKVQICDGQQCASLRPIVELVPGGQGMLRTSWGLGVVPVANR